MPKLEELLRLVNESSSRTARIQALAAKMDTHTLDDYDANLLSAHLEIVIDNLRTVQEMAGPSRKPVACGKMAAGSMRQRRGSASVREALLKSLCRTNTIWTVLIGSGHSCGMTARTITLPITPISP